MNQTLVEKREKSATEERRLGSSTWLVAPGVWRLKDLFVNVFLIQNREGTEWVLVDTGLKSSAIKIKRFVLELFGSGSRPKAILMTHGHFDHRGSLLQLAKEWDVPVYCHHKERPYLTGQSAYPPADPAVGGGLMALLSFTFPNQPINAEEHLRELPDDGTVPELADWKWIHTPGHTPGHVSLFRERDGVLIAGDALVTTMQESVVSVITQKKYVGGPPKYFTPDWSAAASSVRKLATLEPNVIVTGHGQAMYGDVARRELHKLVRQFWKWGLPAQGRYVKEAARFDVNGVPTYIPSSKGIMLKRIVVAAGLMAVGLLMLRYRRQQKGLKGKLLDAFGKQLLSTSYAALGATAPAIPAAPAIPLIPAI